MEQDTRNVLGTLMGFTGYLLARVEALERALIQKDAVSRDELRGLMTETERGLEPNWRWIGNPLYNQDFARAIEDTVRRLKEGHA
jgi:hypothetical protein